MARVPVHDLSGIGPKQAEKLSRLNIFSVQDLLLHLPFRYEDRTRIIPMAELRPGMLVVIQGEIISNDIIPARRRMLACQLSDGQSVIGLRFFNFFPNQRRQLAVGNTVRCFGEVRMGQRSLEIIHPEYQVVDPEDLETGVTSFTPIYPTTEGIGQASLRRWIDSALAYLKGSHFTDLLSQAHLRQLKLPELDLNQTIQFLHHPPSDTDLGQLNEGLHPSQQRLICEELLAHQISMLNLKKQTQAFRAHAIDCSNAHIQALLDALPFTPTSAQQRVYEDICHDLGQSSPMMRLVQGDVGSGKTLVAIMAALQVLANNQQVALMAPTELLSEQHFEQFARYLSQLGYKTVWLTSKLKAAEKRQALAAIQSDSPLMVVGTHALFQDQVVFKKLGLVIVDEQHRFGVHQRLSLKEKGIEADAHPHQIVMTATPIPRTLAMSVYADLDTSIIDELPPGRTPVSTLAMTDDKRATLIKRLDHACREERRQAYWVCTLIEESENLQAQAAEKTYDLLTTELPQLAVGLIHGRMKSQDKSDVMAHFKAGKIDILVATTVIEVGVDVPNASLMVIENAERLGLAQLHQLRGRVGRGATASHCILLYHPPLSNHGEQRIAVMRESNDGFVIAEKDLALRGPGEVLGTRQTGVASFRIADLYRDRDHLPRVHQMASQLVAENWQHNKTLVRRWLGMKEQYAKV
jgi:ATP-dependent DNA helicase RecG